ncbi:hypothetical protein COCOBI_08-0600 [Coccomyxa sp. Obi]|nr:hypothetical protein COCOBI_08-0600 [Coccomyxa sp. Obi]
MHAVKRWPPPEEWSSDTETCPSCGPSSYPSDPPSTGNSEAQVDYDTTPPPPPNTPCAIRPTRLGRNLSECGASRQLRRCAHVMEDSARMPEGTIFTSACTREAVQIHPTSGVDQLRGGPQGRPPVRITPAPGVDLSGTGREAARRLPVTLPAGVDETSSGRGLEAAKNPALAIAACPEVDWRLQMRWFYGCRF